MHSIMQIIPQLFFFSHIKYILEHNTIKLQINNKYLENPSKYLQTNPWSTKNSRGILEFEVNKNENTSYEYLWDIAKAAVRRKFWFLKYFEKSQINDFLFYLKSKLNPKQKNKNV